MVTNRSKERQVTAVFVLSVLALTRGLGLLAGLWGSYHPRPTYPFLVAEDGLRYVDVPARLIDLFDRWDAHLYVLIAQGGYAHSEILAAFFPLYPLGMRLIARVGLSLPAAGLLLAWVALLMALALFVQLAREDQDEATVRRAALIFLLYPGGFFLTAVYSESLFLLCALAAFVLTRRRRFVLAAVCGALAALCRPVGVLLAPALLAEVWGALTAPVEPGVSRLTRAKLVLPVLGPLLGLATFAAYQAHAYGDALHFQHVQATWKRHLSFPWSAFFKFQFNPDYYLITLLALGLLVWAFRRGGRASYLAFVTAGLLVPLSSGTLQSLPRFVAVLFPLFFWAGTALKQRWQMTVLTCACLALWVYYPARFAMGYAFN